MLHVNNIHEQHSQLNFYCFTVFPQILKKDLYFDPEFWNLMALRASCINLMSQTVESAALEEILEWVPDPDCCPQNPDLNLNTHSSDIQQSTEVAKDQAGPKECQTKDDTNHVTTRQRTKKETSLESFRRSFWQLGKTNPQMDEASTSFLAKIKQAAVVLPKFPQMNEASSSLLAKMKQVAVVLPKLGFALWPLRSSQDGVYSSSDTWWDPKDDSSSNDSDLLHSGLESLGKAKPVHKARKLNRDAPFKTLTLPANAKGKYQDRQSSPSSDNLFIT